jgi:hypothetical protein
MVGKLRLLPLSLRAPASVKTNYHLLAASF